MMRYVKILDLQYVAIYARHVISYYHCINVICIPKHRKTRGYLKIDSIKRVYGLFSIETLHERRKRKRGFVLLIRIGKQNVKIKYI